MKSSINRHYKSLLLTTLLTLFFTSESWGQTYTIIPSTQTQVTERVDTIYVADGVARELFVPEIRNNDGHGSGDLRYRWYVRWYREDKAQLNNIIKSTDVKITNANLVLGGTATVGTHKASLKSTKDGTSLFWYNDFYTDLNSSATGASTVTYQKDVVTDDVIICDISLNNKTKIKADNDSIIEPIISVRYKFVIRPASIIADRIKESQANEESPYVQENISTSENALKVNVQLGMMANNYAWYKGSDIIVGNKYQYKINGGTLQTLNEWEQIISLPETLSTETTIDLWAIDKNNNRSPLLVKYKLTPTPDAGFVLEEEMTNNTDLDMKREPEEHPDVYELLGSINFDRNDLITMDELKNDVSKNIAKIGFPQSENDKGKWLAPDATGYAPYDYNNQQYASSLNRVQTLQNQYGLFRTANLEKISKDATSSFISGQNNYWFIAKQYTSGTTNTSPAVYDRTYLNTKGSENEKLGFFFFVDAANLPGRLVKIKLDGTICSHTGILVNFWINDMTTRANETNTGSQGGKPLPPNINLNFIGKKKNSEEESILHRFTTGDAETNYTKKIPYTTEKDGKTYTYETNENIGKWQQLAYTFVINENVSDYDEFYLEVQNNTIHSYGSDYAIDELRVYRTKPVIGVDRIDACSSNKLTVATEYNTLLRNMGWTINPDVLTGLNIGTDATEDNRHLLKYRYGLMGADANKREQYPYVGNVYFGVTDKKAGGDPTKEEDWIVLNKDLQDYSNQSYNSRSRVYRITVPTTEEAREKRFPDIDNEQAAMQQQILWNLRMVNDYYYDAKELNIWNKDIQEHLIDEGIYNSKEEYFDYIQKELEELCPQYSDYTVNNVKAQEIMEDERLGDRYERLIRAVCSVMGISRLRVSWWEGDGTINLSTINVNKTNMLYKGQRIYEGSVQTDRTASGEYDVVIFSALTVTDSNKQIDFPNAAVGSDFNDPCLLTTPFTILPSITIVAQTGTNAQAGIVCEGRINTIEDATVWVRDVDDANNLTDNATPFESKFNQNYTLDWFLGTKEEYDLFDKDLHLAELLKTFRGTQENPLARFTPEALIEYYKEDKYSEEQLTALQTLLLGDEENEPKLIIGDEDKKATFRWVEWVVVIPFLPEKISVEGKEWLFCEDPQEYHLDIAPAPNLWVGFPNMDYPEGYTNAPLRIGLPNIIEGGIQNIPIRDDGFSTGMQGTAQLGKPESSTLDIYLRRGQEYIQVGTLKELGATKDDGGKFSMDFIENASGYFHEGQTYTLYIPFGERNADGDFIPASCEGYTTLPVKIVPEYLTWQGQEEQAAWYNDGLWKQSTKGELYKDPTGTSTEDANGSDDISKAFAPLYFTRITIPQQQTLALEEITKNSSDVLQLTDEQQQRATSLIQYDMAVNKNDQQKTVIVPYYINTVKEIYLKPEARLRHQQLLAYDTARVEFEMTPNAKYWMASPLHSVFAGDMYTRKNSGLQNTYAFDYITYNTENNDRQAPAFYQKAWDKAITMYESSDGTNQGILPEKDLISSKYEVVQSNWSIEYNDVNVPYALGKGFYASVEKKNATELTDKVLVRLPKADSKYDYEPWVPTKAQAPALAQRARSGRLADSEEIEVVLKDADTKEEWWETAEGKVLPIADGDGKHYLLGNPYMYPLDIRSFLKANEEVLAQKYWTHNGEELTVGTPDVEWTGDEIDGNSTATIAPMQAFFVELKEDPKKEETETLSEPGTKADEASDSETVNAVKTVRFNTSMMLGEPETNAASSLRAAMAKSPVLKLTAERNGHRSTALLTQRDNASNQYEADKDAVILLDKELSEVPQVYTIAESHAVGVNVARRISQVPLGVYAGDGKGDITLTIEGMNDWVETLYLYDAVTRKSIELTGDTYTLHLDGSSHGRYFLRSDMATANEQIQDAAAISVYSVVAGKVTVSASEALKRVQVYTPMGRLVCTLYPATSAYTFDLPAGIYFIRAEIAHDQKTVKLRVR